MKNSITLASLLFAAFAVTAPAVDWVEQMGEYLTFSALDGNVRLRLSGMLDLEAYRVDRPAPGLIFTDNDTLFNPRLVLFVDAQFGPHVYGFLQTRVDRGFDPSEGDARMRLDEYALRFTPFDDWKFSVQIGQFATIVGNWTKRHDSWSNPFITAPGPYENLTGIWDDAPIKSAAQLLHWSHAIPGQSAAKVYADKDLRNPIIWGPCYATGVAISGMIGMLEYAAEMKNAALASRPKSWSISEVNMDHPTFSGRLGLRPNQMWNVGLSLSDGPYLLDVAQEHLPPGKSLDDYREWVIAQDISFEWHRFQFWAEFFETRFEVPVLGHVDTFAYYLEAKYKLTPQLFGSLRWNQQFFSNIRDKFDNLVPWGRDMWRVDMGIGYRFTAHTQMKLQYSFQQEDFALHNITNMLAAQFTLRF